MFGKTLIAALAVLVAATGAANAAPAPEKPEQQTPWGLYVDSKEAYAMKTGPDGDKVLLVDVREPAEIMFTGFAPIVDVNVPYLRVNTAKRHAEKPVFAMEQNPDFEAQIGEALAARGLPKSTPILLMCRSGGERGAPSAKQLWGKGYDKVYVVVDGFEGSTIKDGERKNWRLIDGWKNSGLPWGYALPAEKFPYAAPLVK